MFKWKISTRKGTKQEKLNNELNNKHFLSNGKKKADKEPENNKRNAALREMEERRAPVSSGASPRSPSQPAPNSAPHRAPSHPAPPSASTDLTTIPPHSTYPTTQAPAPGPVMAQAPAQAPAPASAPASAPAGARGVLTPTQPRPPPYVPPPSGRVRAMTSQATQVEGAGQPADPLNTSVASSTATDSTRTGAGSSSWMEWTQQLQAYVAWVNSQLRKKEGYKLVTDLRADLHSGVVLADLIEIVSGEKIAGIYRLPETAQMMRENVERILQFMAAKRIRMHHVSSKEVIEGNLKAVMRLILALAAHYKPQSVRTSPYDTGGTGAGQTATSSAGPAWTPPSEVAKPAVSQQSTSSSGAPTASSSSTTAADFSSKPAATSTSTSTAAAEPTATTSSSSNTPARRPGLPNTSSSSATPNLNVPGNRKSIGHLLEGGLSVAPLRRFPSVAGHQWSTAAGDDGDGDVDGDDDNETRIDDDDEVAASERSDAAASERRRGRRQWGLPGPPLYENLPRSSSFASRSSERPVVRAERIYDVPRGRPARVPESPDAGEDGPVDRQPGRQSGGPVDRPSVRQPRELVDGFSSLPRHGVRPAALDFWESITAHSTGTSSPNTSGEFRYNTVHRLSGRRLLPKTPDVRGGGGGGPGGGPGAGGVGGSRPVDEPEQRSLGSRGEVEGSSSHGSPTASMARSREQAVAEWLRGTPARRSDTWARPEAGSELWRNSALRRSVQTESWAGRPAPQRSAGTGTPAEPPSYEALLQELSRARRQLIALQELLLDGQQEGSEGRGTNTADEFVFLKSRLNGAAEQCHSLQAELGRAGQSFPDENGGVDAEKNHLRNAFNRYAYQSEQSELSARLSAQERELQQLRRALADKDKAIHLQQSQFDDAIKALATSAGRPSENGRGSSQSPVTKTRGSGREELHILRDAISSLRANFRESDPNHHTLDTLEQCLAIVLDRLAAAESGRHDQQTPGTPAPNKRAPITSLHGQHTFTKVVYYTEKTLTPFLSSIPKQLGEITLRDFKQIFDRPGNFRFHFKSMDPEFGMVKEEISSDDEILPGFDGKLISWVVEDHGL